MNWNKLTVAHYQALYPIITDTELDSTDKDFKVVSVITGMTEAEIDNLTIGEYNKLKNQVSFIYENVPGGAARFIKGKRRKYRINYDINRIPFARYAEVKTFKGECDADFIRNMHKLIASMVQPVKFGFPVKYKADKHEEYANDLLDAKFIDVYRTCVFFYHLFVASTASLKDYFTKAMMKAGKNIEEAETIHQSLCDDLAGFLVANKLPSLKGSLLSKLGTSQLFKPLTTSAI